MKSFFKFLGVIVLVAAIGFSMVGCKDDGGGGGGGGGGGINWVGKWVKVDDSTEYLILKADKTWTSAEGQQNEGMFGTWVYDENYFMGKALVLSYTSVQGTTVARPYIIKQIIDSTTVEFEYEGTFKKQ